MFRYVFTWIGMVLEEDEEAEEQKNKRVIKRTWFHKII